jgi:hypothetical protein
MRAQHPKAFLDSRTRRNWAGVYYDENGPRRYVTLGPKNELKKAAQNKLDQIVGPINVIRAARDVTAGTTLAQYILRAPTSSTAGGSGRPQPREQPSSGSVATSSAANWRRCACRS